MKKIVFVLLLGSLMLGAQEKKAVPDCPLFVKSMEMMSKGTEINYNNITRLQNKLNGEANETRIKQVKLVLSYMNNETKTRAANAQYPKMYAELKKGYEANCGHFTAEENATLTGIIERSIAFNNILAKTLGDPLSLSKVQIPDIQSAVERAVQTYSKEMNNTAVLLLLEKEGKTYKASAGFADRESKQAVSSNALFEIGSATKVFTGIAIFQLIESGKLSLDTKLNTFYKEGEITKLANYKGKNYWDEVTVGMLLQHTSGFIDYLNVYGADDKAIKVLGGDEKHFTFDQLIHQSVGFGDANFKPGEKFKYCNTGFVILGDIIAKISGMDWHDYVQKNILDKAGMKHTYFGSRISKVLREQMPKGYMTGKEVTMAPSLADSAGEIISTLDDLAALMKAWAGGKLYSKTETLKLQLTQGFHQQYAHVPHILYGYAIMKIDGFYGHGGQTFGFQSYMAVNPRTSDVYVVGVNDSTVGAMNFFMALAGLNPQ